jgi:hypothetical protein
MKEGRRHNMLYPRGDVKKKGGRHYMQYTRGKVMKKEREALQAIPLRRRKEELAGGTTFYTPEETESGSGRH